MSLPSGVVRTRILRPGTVPLLAATFMALACSGDITSPGATPLDESQMPSEDGTPGTDKDDPSSPAKEAGGSEPDSPGPQATAGAPGSAGNGGGPQTGSGGSSSGTEAGSTSVPPTTTSADPIVPFRIRRLSNRELSNALRALLGTSTNYETSLPNDIRQRNFTVNQAQTVSSDWHAEIERLARAAAQELKASGGFDRLSPCAGQSTDTCADSFTAELAKRAFRRTPQTAELNELKAVYQAGAAESGFERGMELVLATILQSPSFLYLTELGGGDAGALTGEEIATQLAFVTTQRPPDAELDRAAADGQLKDSNVRAQHARRLLSTEPGRETLTNLIVEWFTSDWVLDAAKDNIPEFNQSRQELFSESRDFARVIVENHEADFRTLLTADFTVATQNVASYYGLNGSGEVALTGTPRLGLLTQAAFLGGHSSPTESSPVRRGSAFMRQVLCSDPPDPASVNLTVAAPPPDPSKSTRELFAAHSEDALCQSCHATIDPIGFAFEEFDEGGRVRTAADNNGVEVDASGTVTLGGETFTFDNAKDFLTQVANSNLAQKCVARTATRYAFGWANPATELEFVKAWEQMDQSAKTQIDEVLIALVASDLFIQRRTQ